MENHSSGQEQAGRVVGKEREEADGTAGSPPPGFAGEGEPPPTRAEFEELAARVRRLAARMANGRG